MEWINLYHNPTHSETPRFAHFQTSLRTIRIQYSNLYLSTVKFIRVQTGMNLFTPSYKVVTSQHLNRNYIFQENI